MSSSLLIDLYELTMAAGYLRHGMQDRPAAFDLYFRRNPFGGAYALFAGLEPALRHISGLRFPAPDLDYLRGLGLFEERFLRWLGAFRFRGRVTAVPEGEAVFAGEPLITVEGGLAEAQIVETALLNLVNFQTLIASKASRLARAAGSGTIVEFGARRAQGPDGALGAARAACIGGARVTSNLMAGRVHGIPVAGTQAHSWVMSFDTELEAFRAYARSFPDHCVLLLDTYDTLASGLPNAIQVAGELRAAGHELRGVRLDSGDIASLSRETRRRLDDAGFPQARILASDEIDELAIESIRRRGGMVDVYGVGTRLVTGAGEAGGALGGVYKLVELDGRPRIKVSSDPSKSTWPGLKRLWRITAADGRPVMDLISGAGELPGPGDPILNPADPSVAARLPEGTGARDRRRVVMEDGELRGEPAGLMAIADHAAADLSLLPEGCHRLERPEVYPVRVTARLAALRESAAASAER